MTVIMSSSNTRVIIHSLSLVSSISLSNSSIVVLAQNATFSILFLSSLVVIILPSSTPSSKENIVVHNNRARC